MKYITKPLEVDVVQWDGTLQGLDELYQVFGESFSIVSTFKYMTKEEAIELSIRTVNGNVRAYKNDYIVRGSMGEFYVLKKYMLNELYIKKEN